MGIDKKIFSEAAPLDIYDQELVAMYAEYGVSVDSLIASDVFDVFRAKLATRGYDKTKEEIASRLLNLRKAGRLSMLSMVDSKERIQHILTATGITTMANVGVKSEQLQEMIDSYVHDSNVMSFTIHRTNIENAFDVVVKYIKK